MNEGDKLFSAMLLNHGAIRISADKPFVWASGWRSPIYTDNRKVLALPAVRTYVKAALALLIDRHFPAATAVAGVATGAIAQGALVADMRGLPFCYVRSAAKDHGAGNLIEGELPAGSRVVVVEDLISTGASSLKAVGALRDAGYDVIGMAASFTYGFPVAEEAFRAAGVELRALTDYTTTMAVANKLGLVSDADAALLARWRDAPDTWTGK
ncbi:MAG: orotate phosphoribosyltransferase [Prevotella sp.]|nr:orotate phosphoribosyltransferase [Prevotella sp.]